MLEANIDLNFLQYQEDLMMRPRGTWPSRLRDFLDRFIQRDEIELLERANIPFNKRYEIVERLDRLNEHSGYYQGFIGLFDQLVRNCCDGPRDNPIRILDIGTGSGGILKAVHRWSKDHCRSVELSGIDSSGDFVIATDFNLNTQGIPVRIYRAEAWDLKDFENDSFDIVLSSYVVHHIRTAGKVGLFMSEVHRIARQGWLIVDFERRLYAPAMIGLIGYLLSGSWILASDGVRSVQRAYRTEEMNFILSELAKAQGISGMSCSSYPFFPYWVVEGKKHRDFKVECP